MVHDLTYRTDDVTRWGTGQGSDLDADVIDLDFWYLFSGIKTLEQNAAANANVGIDFISVAGNQLFVHLTNHAVEGPFTIPVAFWHPQGNWKPNQNYVPLDVVSVDGKLYITNVAHLSAATFNAFATDGSSQNLYTLLLEQPMDEIPIGGIPGQRLAKRSNTDYETQWATDFVRLALFIGGRPDSGELVLQYPVTDHITFPEGLVGSVAFANIHSAEEAVFQINKNGAAIGQIVFAPSPVVTVDFFGDIACVPGDIITITAPVPQDSALSDISLSIVAALGL